MSAQQRRTLERWARFNVVGIAGTAVQLLALWFLAHALRMQTVAATAAAVEVALLHNFGWHEAWTWRGCAVERRWRRLLQFHLTSGIVSIASNTVLTWAFLRQPGWHLLTANLAAIVVTSGLNFVLANALVFEGVDHGHGATRVGSL